MCSVCSLAEHSFQDFLKFLFELKLFLEASCIDLKAPKIKNPPKLFKISLLTVKHMPLTLSLNLSSLCIQLSDLLSLFC